MVPKHTCQVVPKSIQICHTRCSSVEGTAGLLGLLLSPAKGFGHTAVFCGIPELESVTQQTHLPHPLACTDRKNGNDQSISHAMKPFNCTKAAGTSLKERFCLTISTFSSALMKGPSSNIESVVISSFFPYSQS